MNIKSSFLKLTVFILAIGTVAIPSASNAAQISSRSVSISSSTAGTAGVDYNFNFTVPTGSNIQSVDILVCDQAVGACTNTGSSTGFSAASAALNGPPQGFGGGGTWTAANSQYDFKITRPTVTSGPTGAQSISFSNVTNPTNVDVNGFYFRITTYTSATYTGAVDTGTVVAVINSQLVVSGTMPESLVFCVGSTGTDCSNITGSTVSLGTFTPTATNVGTSVMSASTNAGSGYAITMNGSTMTSGSNTIAPMGTQTLNSSGCAVSCTSAIGQGQWGVNFMANTVASAGGAFGNGVSGLGAGTAFGGYGTTNAFRFFTGDTVAVATGPSDTNLYTASYLVNVGGSQAAGVYTATLTYICTATF